MTITVLLAGGGTGGHVYPLIAVADALTRRAGEVRVVFVGTERGIEKKVVPARGYALELVEVVPIRGTGIAGAMSGTFRAILSLPESYRLLQRTRPSVVLTVGGYAAGPVSAMARAAGIPLALLEPNAVMGLSNRLIAPWVNRAYTAFAPAERHFAQSKVLRAGVPIRDGFLPSPWEPKARPQHVLVLGGSQGARTLNDHVPHALALQKVPLVVRHQCGVADADRVRSTYAATGMTDATVEPFIDDMPAAIRDADLVISRSGASAVSEICAVGRANLLVPYPHAAGNHQERNAATLAAAGASRWIANGEATPDRLANALATMLGDVTSMRNMADLARSIGRPQAAAQIADDLLWLAGSGAPTSSVARSTNDSAKEYE